MSQSLQVAPYNAQYLFDNSQSVSPISNTDNTQYNTYHGGIYQQGASAVTNINSSVWGGEEYTTLGIEYDSDATDSSKGYVQWFANGATSWKLTPPSIGPDSTTEISQRLISVEPMSIIMNLGMAYSFEPQDFSRLVFPSSMYIDYIRIYQSPTLQNGLTCDPPNFPTADYINNHLPAYQNPNFTTWEQAGYSYPKNSLVDQC